MDRKARASHGGNSISLSKASRVNGFSMPLLTLPLTDFMPVHRTVDALLERAHTQHVNLEI